MSFKEFDMTELEENKRKYAHEIRERWGDTDAYKESEEKTANYTEVQWAAISGEGADILREFSAIRQLNPEYEAAQSLVKRWQDYITANFYECSKEILSCLGAIYTGDERFTQSIDANGEGTAEFMAKAIAFYCA